MLLCGLPYEIAEAGEIAMIGIQLNGTGNVMVLVPPSVLLQALS